ncbi:MAG TPA: YidB family protein [Rhizomicrobium sp.]
MGMLDGLVEGMVGAEMVYVVNGILQKHGGVSGVVDQLKTQGLGPAVNSWISDTTTNMSVTPAQMHQAFGDQTINELAAKSGLTPQELTQKLAQVLPHAVNAATPGGVVPPAGTPPPA